jgi:hypothetical protein
MAKDDKRFLKTYTQGGFPDNLMQIWVDKKTGVNYLYSASGYSGGLTVLLNRDGTPVITPVPTEYDE